MAAFPPAACADGSYVMVESERDGAASVPDYLDAIASEIDDLSADARDISLEIHDHPELQYKEYHAHKVLTEFLDQQHGWKVTPHAYGIETAFVAVFESGSSGPVVSFNAEYGTLYHGIAAF